MSLKVPKETFALWFGYDGEDDKAELVEGILACQEFLLVEHEEEILFRQETFEVCRKILLGNVVN